MCSHNNFDIRIGAWFGRIAKYAKCVDCKLLWLLEIIK